MLLQIAEEMEKERRVFQLQMCEVMSYSISVYYLIGMLINGQKKCKSYFFENLEKLYIYGYYRLK